MPEARKAMFSIGRIYSTLGRELHPYSDAGSRIIPNPSNVVLYRLEK